MRLVAALVLLIILGGAIYFFKIRTKLEEPGPMGRTPMSERVTLKTQDNIAIVGDYYPSVLPSAKGLLLLHMMPATRSSWKALAEKMQPAGWHVLAIDFRGHGESQGGSNGYRGFSDAEHQASKFDAEAGAEFLSSQGVTALYLGGASIGANLALNYLAEHAETKAAFLLSPGLDFRGVKTEPTAQNLKPGQSVFYVASRDDSYSAETIQKLFEATPAGVRKDIKFFQTAGHGTTIFEKESQFMDDIAAWLQGL